MAVDVAHLETPSAGEPTDRAIEDRREGSWAPLLEPNPGGTAFAVAVHTASGDLDGGHRVAAEAIQPS